MANQRKPDVVYVSLKPNRVYVEERNTTMKKILIAILVIAVVAASIFALASLGILDGPIDFVKGLFGGEEYTVTFDSDGGTAVESQTVKAGETATAPTAPTKEGYTFAGWYNGATKYDFTAPVESDLTLKAKWTENVIPEPPAPTTYTVTFDSNGGTTVVAQTVTEGGKVTAPTAPTKEGYTFDGWFVGETAYDFNATVTANVTLVAAWTQITYTVTFDSNEGSEVEAQTVAHGETATEPTAPTKAGYAFVGWFVGEDAYDFTTPVTANVTLVAAWTQITYTVTFDSNGGSAVDAQTVAEGAVATEPTAPTKAGYTFDGWFVEDTAYDFTTPVTANVTLVAAWTQITYTVTFDSNGGSAVDAQTVAEGETATEPTAPTKAGFAFVGWFVEDAAYDFATAVTAPVTLTAKWELDLPDLTEYAGTWTGEESTGYTSNDYTVVINANGTVTVAYENGYTTVNATVNYVILDGNTLTVNCTASATTKDLVFAIEDNKSVMTTDSAVGGYALTLAKNYTVTFDFGEYDKDPAIVSVPYGSTVKENTTNRTGYNRDGWYLEGSDTAFDFKNNTITSDITLVARWTIKTYTVTFVDQNGDVVKTVTVEHNGYVPETEIPTTATTNEGYTFNGRWYTSKTSTSPVKFETTKITADKTYHPGLIASMADFAGSWMGTNSKGETYSMTIDAVNNLTSMKLVKDGITDELDVTVVWFNGTKLIVRYLRDTDTSEQILTLTLQANGSFTASNSLAMKRQYVVIFDSNGGSAIGAVLANAGEPLTKPENPTKEGFAFVEWLLNGEVYDFTAPVTGAMHLVASWTTKTYTVTFDTDGGSAVDAQTVAHGATATEPTTPTKDSYAFVGWFVGDAAYDFATPVYDDVTITAKWNKVYTVTFNSDGGSAVEAQTVVEGTTATEPTAPTKEGFVFNGWYVDGVAYDFTAAVTADVTLTAQWKEIVTYTVTLVNGTTSTSQSVLSGECAVAPADPSKSGKVFMGWYNGADKYDFATPVTSNLTLEAKWGAKVTFFNQNKEEVKSMVVEIDTLIPESEIPEAQVNEGFVFTGNWHKSYTVSAAPVYLTDPITAETKLYPGVIKTTIADELEGTWTGEKNGETYTFTITVSKDGAGNVTGVSVTTDYFVVAEVPVDTSKPMTYQYNTSSSYTQLAIKYYKTTTSSAATLAINYYPDGSVKVGSPSITLTKQP